MHPRPSPARQRPGLRAPIERCPWTARGCTLLLALACAFAQPLAYAWVAAVTTVLVLDARTAAASPASTLPLPSRSRFEGRQGSREDARQSGEAAPATPAEAEAAPPAPANAPKFRYTVIAPEGRPVTPVPDARPRDDAELSEEQRQYTRWAYGVLASLRFHKGEVELPNGLAKLNLTAGYEYLNVEDATRVLEEVWGNPPGEPVLGLIVPEGQTPFAADSWGIVLHYRATGHVPDGDRERIDFPALITPLKAQVERLNEQRKAAGYPTANLLGWAALPRYDLARHILQWGTMTQFSNEQTRTMNYEVRLLGRTGVLSLSIVANANQYPDIVARVPKIIDMFTWMPGNTYDDYQEDVDVRAPGGLDTLITGTLAKPADTGSAWWWALLLVPLLGGAGYACHRWLAPRLRHRGVLTEALAGGLAALHALRGRWPFRWRLPLRWPGRRQG